MVPLADAQWALEALAGLSDGVLVVDATGRTVYANPAAIRLFGERGANEVIALARDGETFFRSDERTAFAWEELPFASALAGRSCHDVALFVRCAVTAGGVHLLSNCTPLSGGRGAVFFFHDATEQRERQRRLVEAERQRTAILDNIPDMTWLKDRDGRFVAVNQRFLDVHAKRRAEDVVGLTDFDLSPADLAKSYREDDYEVVRSARGRRIEEQSIDATGTTRWIDTIKTPVLDENGEVIGTAGTARDITERKHAEGLLRMTNDELERRVTERTRELAAAQEALVRQERLAVLGQLAGGVAHQIRNPLGAIFNAAYVLKRHLAPPQHPNVVDAIAIIHDEVRHVDVIITSLLDYARVCVPKRAPASIVDVVNRALSAERIPPAIRVERAIVDVETLDIDAEQIHAALFNVVRNAVEAMPEGGVLRVEVSAIEGEAAIAVSDTGPGLSAHARAHLFEPLQSTKPMGVGLGLVTARTLVEAHGGRIMAVDTQRGARFELRLPLR